MDFTRRRIATTTVILAATPFLDTREADATVSAAASNPTIAPYDTGLAGVDQSGNMLFTYILWGSMAVVAIILTAIRLRNNFQSHLRQVSAMGVPAEKQTYWKLAQPSWMPSLKKHIVFAPLWKKRHNREFRLSSAINMGTLPSRLHTVLLVLYFVSNMVYMLVLSWSGEDRYAFFAELRGRSGTLAAVNMVPLVILAARNNPLIPCLNVSFDTFNLFHRWMGRTVALEVAIHTIAWAVVQVADGGWSSVGSKLVHNDFLASGMVGGLAFAIIVVLSCGPVRHAFYETFLNTHILLATIIFACTWIHCYTAEVPGGLPQLPWVIALTLIWCVERLLRVVWTAVRSRGFVDAVVEAMPCEACRVTIHLPRYTDVKPGTHAYIRFLELNFWENHPFSIAWVEHKPRDPSLPSHEKDLSAMPPTNSLKTSVSFVIGAHTGFTRKLYNRARAALAEGTAKVTLRATFEGPYAGHHSLDSYGHAVLIAGATGITHQLSYIRHLIEGANAGTVATRRITLVWVVRDDGAFKWIHPWMDRILAMPNRRSILQIQLFVTRPKSAKDIKSLSGTMHVFPGRPNIPHLIQKEVAEQVGAMCVSVCGPGALADDVRGAVRSVLATGTVVDFFEESFTW